MPTCDVVFVVRFDVRAVNFWAIVPVNDHVRHVLYGVVSFLASVLPNYAIVSVPWLGSWLLFFVRSMRTINENYVHFVRWRPFLQRKRNQFKWEGGGKGVTIHRPIGTVTKYRFLLIKGRVPTYVVYLMDVSDLPIAARLRYVRQDIMGYFLSVASPYRGNVGPFKASFEFRFRVRNCIVHGNLTARKLGELIPFGSLHYLCNVHFRVVVCLVVAPTARIRSLRVGVASHFSVVFCDSILFRVSTKGFFRRVTGVPIFKEYGANRVVFRNVLSSPCTPQAGLCFFRRSDFLLRFSD